MSAAMVTEVTVNLLTPCQLTSMLLLLLSVLNAEASGLLLPAMLPSFI